MFIFEQIYLLEYEFGNASFAQAKNFMSFLIFSSVLGVLRVVSVIIELYHIIDRL